MISFKDFVKNKEITNKNTQRLFEGFKKEDFSKVFKLIRDLLKKNVDGNILVDSNPLGLSINNDVYQSYFIYVQKNKNKFPDRALSINYKVNSQSFDPYSVTFYDYEELEKLMWDENTSSIKASLEINFMGASLIYYLPVIYHVLNTGDYSLSETKIKELAGKVYNNKLKESYHKFYIGALEYKVYENISNEKLNDIFNIKSEIARKNGYNSIMENELERAKDETREKAKTAMKNGDTELSKQLWKEYNNILKAMRGGATTLDELEISTKRNVKVSLDQDKETKEAVQQFQKKTKDPDKAFKQMHAYISAVIKGLQPGCIICGAPGVGKTYRILTQLKAKGYINGQNMDIIKGKCTPRQLYLSLYEHKTKGHMIVIDDADALVGPKAPEDVINILKGALDSSNDDEGGRLVSYRVTGELKNDDGEVIPKTMSFAGSVIVITNYSVGQLDTALRNRVFTQSLEFSTQQLLDIIKEIMPAIDPVNLSAKCKIQAYEYLSELAEKGAKMEISIRSFCTCARCFRLGEDPENDLSAEDVKEMIEEQMANQHARGGKKY